MYKVKRGTKWRFFERYKDPLTGKNKIASVTMDKGGRQATRDAQIILTNKIMKIMAQVNTSQTIRGIRLDNLVNEFMNDYRKRVRLTTYYNHLTMAKRVLNEIGSDALVENISPLVLSNLFDNLLYGPKPISNGYVSKYRTFLNQLFKFAIKNSYRIDNPVDKVEVNYRSDNYSPGTKTKFLEDDELKAVLEWAYSHNHTYGQLCEWLYQTGTRVGESTSLSFEDVYQDDDQWIASISGTLEYNHVQIMDQKKTDQTKTRAGMRSIVLSDRAVEIYNERLATKAVSYFVFSTEKGTPIQTSALNTFLRQAKKELEINKPLSSHIFRHTHISKLAELGVPLYVIQQRVGHSNSRITEEIYLHVTKKARNQVIPALKKL